MTTMRKMVVKIMKELGFETVDEAGDGALAWQAISSAKPGYGLVVSDWNMPNCTGLDLLKRVRGDARMTGLPFLMVTAEAEQGQIAEAIKAGVSQYIVKPFSKDSIQAKLLAMYQKASA
jgi:two-component system chemotaxis response regulator CheY